MRNLTSAVTTGESVSSEIHLGVFCISQESEVLGFSCCHKYNIKLGLHYVCVEMIYRFTSVFRECLAW